jgi:hypothetical protein
MKEIWKPVIGYEGIYSVSNIGRVMSMERLSLIPKNGIGATGIRKQKLMKINAPMKKGRQYYYCSLRKNNKNKKHNIHILMWRAFVDPNYEPGYFKIDHIDGKKFHNELTNLQLLTSRENISKGFQQLGRLLPTGVTLAYGGKYVARIRVNKKLIHIGTFLTPLEAEEEYKKFLSKL